MAGDDEGVDSDRLFVTPIRQLLRSGLGLLRWRHTPRINYTVLLGRAVTSDTQTLDTIVDARGAQATDAKFLGDGTAVSNTGLSWPSAMGVWAWVTSTIINGNAIAALPAVASVFGDAIYEVQQILHTITCDATVATRVPTLAIGSGMPRQVGDTDFPQTGPSLTASQTGAIFVPRGPAVVKLNDNGTFSDGATSPLPVYLSEGGSVSVTVAAGVVGDLHLLSALARRIA
jgi:hypothetical protein